MKKLCVRSLCLGSILAVSTSHAMDLKQSKLTQVVNEVQIISAADQKQKSAAVNDVFSMPDILRTGTASRAELVASDETVTRVGANTIFLLETDAAHVLQRVAVGAVDVDDNYVGFQFPHLGVQSGASAENRHHGETFRFQGLTNR